MAGSPDAARRRCLRTAGALGCATLGLPLAGCGRRHADGTIRFWAMGREAEVVGPMLRDFEREHPGLRVRVEQLPWSAAHEKLLTAFAGDATPDVAQMGNTWVPEFAAIGALVPLDARVAATPDVAPVDYFDGIWQTNRVDGRLYGVPWYVDTRLLFYRRDLLAQAGFEQVPTDWAGWLRALQAVKQHVGPNRYAVLLPLNEYEPLLALALQQPEPLLRDGGRYGAFRSAGFRRTWAMYLKIFDLGLAPPSSNTEVANVWNEFARGYFSFYISGPWQIGEFRRRLPAALQSAWGAAPLPGPDGPGASIAGGSSLAVFRRATNADAAWQLVRYLSRPAVQQQFHGLTGNLPPRRSAWHDGTLAQDPPTQAFRTQLERARPVPQVPEWERIATELRLVAERVVRGVLDRERALALLDQRADAMLEKRRWMLARQGTA